MVVGNWQWFGQGMLVVPMEAVTGVDKGCSAVKTRGSLGVPMAEQGYGGCIAAERNREGLNL